MEVFLFLVDFSSAFFFSRKFRVGDFEEDMCFSDLFFFHFGDFFILDGGLNHVLLYFFCLFALTKENGEKVKRWFRGGRFFFDLIFFS